MMMGIQITDDWLDIKDDTRLELNTIATVILKKLKSKEDNPNLLFQFLTIYLIHTGEKLKLLELVNKLGLASISYLNRQKKSPNVFLPKPVVKEKYY